MKTPREILSERHQSAQLKLDAIRKDVVAGCTGTRPQEKIPATEVEMPELPTAPSRINIPHRLSLAAKLWQELVLPCRHFWAGVATVWLLILVANVATLDTPQLATIKVSPLSAETVRALQEQKLLLAQLLAPVAPPAAKASSTGPRSEARHELFFA